MDARMRWLRSRWPTSTTLLEMPVYLIVVGVMSAVAVYSYVYAQRHLHVMEALSLASVAETTAMEYRAVTGDWPRSNAQAPFANATVAQKKDDRADSIQIRQGGAVDVGIAREPMKGSVISMRAWTTSTPGTPIIWTCGRATSLVGSAGADDRTTIGTENLPSACRAIATWQ